MDELKVAAFTSDLRADEQPRAVWLSKPRGVAIALYQCEVFVKHRRLHRHLSGDSFLDGQRLFAAATNEQDFFLPQLMQQPAQPCDARIVVEFKLVDGLAGPGVTGKFLLRVRHPFGGIAIRHKRREMRLATGKPAH